MPKNYRTVATDEYREGWDHVFGGGAGAGNQPVIVDPATVVTVGHILPISQEVLEDTPAGLHYQLLNPPEYDGPPAPPLPPPHESHMCNEDGECLLCDEWHWEKLAEVCPFEVVPRER